MDAFTVDWKNIEFYAFPPFSCIPRVIQKIWNDKATGILIVPNWPNQPWYGQFLELIVKEITLPSRPDLLLLLLQNIEVHHPMQKTLQLKAAIVCGKAVEMKQASVKVNNLLLASWAQSTQSSYNGAIKKWLRYCMEDSVEEPFNAPYETEINVLSF